MSKRSSPGGPRPHSEQVIKAAVLSLLLERGYPALTIEGVAARAGVGKTTIYRWWPSRAALVLDAAREHLALGLVPDTGDGREDLRQGLDQLVRTFSDPVAGAVAFVAIAGLEADPSLAETFRARWVTPWRRSLEAALQRAMARGELPADLDLGLAMDLLVGTVFQRTLVIARPATDGLPEALVALLFDGRLGGALGGAQAAREGAAAPIS